MVRMILGIIAGFITWSIIWVGGEALLVQLSPDWYGVHHAAAERAMTEGTGLSGEPLIYIVNLIRSFLTTIGAGYMCALVAGEYRRSTLALGGLLLAAGVAVEVMYWNLAPIWYHLAFLIFLVPMTILGGRLRRSA
ncbi:MAG: hypothetical protein WKF34_13440 [Pyrinomonadaceae bacterium]